MTTSALESLNDALVAAFTGDTPLTALIDDRVFDTRAPAKTPFPYITLGDVSELAADTFGGDGSDVPWTIHLWTRDGTTTGKRQLFEIWGHVRRILSGTLAIAGRALTFGDASLVTTLEDPDDPDRLTMHGVVRFRAITEGT